MKPLNYRGTHEKIPNPIDRESNSTWFWDVLTCGDVLEMDLARPSVSSFLRDRQLTQQIIDRLS